MDEDKKSPVLPEAENFIEREINKDLTEGVYSQVVTRFPPEPNGYMHIGHIKAICIDFGTAETVSYTHLNRDRRRRH